MPSAGCIQEAKDNFSKAQHQTDICSEETANEIKGVVAPHAVCLAGHVIIKSQSQKKHTVITENTNF